MSKVRFMLFLICMLLMVGCAMNLPSQFERKLSFLDRKGLVLATITVHNKIDESDSLIPITYLIGNNGDNDYEKYSHHFIRCLTENRDAYLIVMDLNSGEHFFYSIRGQVRGDWTIPLFEVPMLVNFTIKANEIIYIGNIHLVLRKKASDSEFRAGPIIPLVDQMVIGDATFDVEINDAYEKDMNEFEKAFPNIKGYNVVKRILPSWRRPSPQEFEPKKTHIFFFSRNFKKSEQNEQNEQKGTKGDKFI